MGEKIAIIDSGIGGLSVYNRLYDTKSNACVTYLADNKYFPYGIKKDYELVDILDRLINHFIKNNYKYIIIACNTASVIYNKYLKYRYNDKVLSIIESTISDLYKINNLRKVGIIATNNMILSRVYEKEIKVKLNVSTYSLPCSELVELCENYDEKKIIEYINNNFYYFKDNGIDTLILGCTHFNTISDLIASYFNNKINIICSGYSLIDEIKEDFYITNKNNYIYLTKYDNSYINKIKKIFPNLKNIEIKELNI